MASNQTPTSFQFTEKMRGYIACDEIDFEGGYHRGKDEDTKLMFHLTIRSENIDRFVDDSAHEASAEGYVECEILGGRCPVTEGKFNLFVDTSDDNRRKMLYRLFFRNSSGREMTLSGFKSIQDNIGPDIWADTTTLYVNVFEGRVQHPEESSSPRIASGMLKILPADFAVQLSTFRSYGPSVSNRFAAFAKFGKLFAGSLWETYAPSLLPSKDRLQREIPLYTMEGVADAKITTHPISTKDKLGLNLTRLCREPCDDVVVIIHGLTTSSDMFIMPEHYNLVNYLHDHGFGDVWMLDFRMSNRFDYNLHRHRFNMDDIALYDYPPALEEVRKTVGPNRRIHVICHCLGSVSFMMSLFGGAVDGISSVIANSVALTPRVHWWSKLKLWCGPFFVENFTSIEYMNPYWRRQPGLGIGKLLSWFISLYHRECNVPECHMLSFMWGTGFPAVYMHENLHDVTHRRGGDLYGGNSMHYYRHVRKMVAARGAVKYDKRGKEYDALPNDYFERAAEIETPILLITGQENKIFLDSNIVCHERLDKLAPSRHELKVFPGYGHQDVFMGKNNHLDVFPILVEFLHRHSNGIRQQEENT